MGQPIGKRQLEILELILKRKEPLETIEIVKFIYKKQPTKTIQNIIWRSLNGLEQRGLIRDIRKSLRGYTRYELTKQGKKEIEALKNSVNIIQLK